MKKDKYTKTKEYRFIEWVYKRKVEDKKEYFIVEDLKDDLKEKFGKMPKWIYTKGPKDENGKQQYTLSADGFFRYLRLQELIATRCYSTIAIVIAIIAILVSIIIANRPVKLDDAQLKSAIELIKQENTQDILLEEKILRISTTLSEIETKALPDLTGDIKKIDKQLCDHNKEVEDHLDRHLEITNSNINKKKTKTN